MQFNSFEFALFFLIFFAIYHLFRKKYRVQNILLLLASYSFYAAWDMRFLFLLILPTSLDFAFGIMIHRGAVTLKQRLKMTFMVLGSFLVLIFLQYEAIALNFKNYSFNLAVDWTKIIAANGWMTLGGLILFLCLINLLLSLAKRLEDTTRRKLLVTISIICSLSLLGFFKYFNFFADSFIVLFKNIFGIRLEPTTLKIALPIGISFYIFKTISYTVDVYRKNTESTEKFIDYATYLAFFPQLLAGPIERSRNLIAQIAKPRLNLTSQDIKEGAWLFVWGLFKKIVVADNLCRIVDDIFGPYDLLTVPIVVPEDGLRMLIGIYAFTIQIYGDFSGYTDMSRGLARLLGFNTMLNFNLPYFSITPGVFWRRWHISLSTWLKDYLYIPLGGNRCSNLKIYRNTMITMVLGGLWHGASWTFVLWGAYHGVLLVVYRLLGIEKNHDNYPAWKKVIHGIITFNLISFGWLLFRARNMTTVAVFLQSIFTSPFGSPETVDYCLMIMKFSWFLLFFQIIQNRQKNLEPVFSWNWFARLNILLYVFMALMAFQSSRAVQEFIYFAF